MKRMATWARRAVTWAATWAVAWMMAWAMCGRAAAEVRLPAFFGEHMVLQRSGATAVFGRADPGERVTVELRVPDPSPGGGLFTASAEAVADADGRWRVNLDLRETPAAPGELVVVGSNRIELRDVLVGEVWLCGGQSNMEWPLRLTENAEAAVAEAQVPLLRLFTVGKRVAAEPVDAMELTGRWVVCTPETAAHFSAVGYYFGREVLRSRRAPVGLISSNWGGTPAESWTSEATLQGGGELYAEILRRRDNARARDARVLATQPTTAPWYNQHAAATLYNGMIHPLFPTTLAGVIWYQGESNAGRAWQYRTLLADLIRDWRRGFEAELPFLIVQLANFRQVPETPGEDAWAELREAQAVVARTVPRCGLAVAMDIGEAEDIHPRNKKDVGLRLALLARRVAYGEDVVASGPVFRGMELRGSEAVLSFDFADGGLMVRGDTLGGFAVKGGDGVWRWADARVEGEQVVVSHPEVARPVAVRYAWAINAPAPLYNRWGLPAVPFRTDDDPPATLNNR